MTIPAEPGVTLPQPNASIAETERLILRQWREADIEPNTAMLADPATARFITSDARYCRPRCVACSTRSYRSNDRIASAS